MSYNTPVLKNSFDVIKVECTNSHETCCLEECHIQTLPLIILDRFRMRILPDHRQLDLGHQIFGGFLNFPNSWVQWLNLIDINPSRLCHLNFLINLSILLCLGRWHFNLLARVNCNGSVLGVNTIFHIWEDEVVLAWHCSIDSENTFFVTTPWVNNLPIWVHDEEINYLIFFLCSSRSINEVSSSDVNRLIRSCLV